MPARPAIEIELNPAYLAEARLGFDDLDAAIRDAIPWVIFNVVPARDFDALAEAIRELPSRVRVLRAVVGCELLALSGSRPDVQEWLCRYLDGLNLTEGARYQLAGLYSRLGVEARRRDHLPQAVDFARRGLETVADLPPHAVTSNLYYNLAVAFESSSRPDDAIQAFEDAAEIDEMIGRHEEAAHARECLRLLARRG